MSPKWRSRSDQPGKGKHYQVDEREPTRLPARYGYEPTERVAGVHERSLSAEPYPVENYDAIDYGPVRVVRPMINPQQYAVIGGGFPSYSTYNEPNILKLAEKRKAHLKASTVAYWCPDCGKEFSGADGQTRCPHCQSLNLERSLGNNRWIKADADEKGAAHLIHTRAAGPRADKPCKIDKGLCLTHGYSVSPTVPCPVGGGKPSEEMWALEKDFLEGRISKEKYEKERLKREASDLRNKYTSKYVKGEISEKAWRQKCNEADKIAAPSSDDVLITLEQRSLAQGKPTDHNKQYNGWSNWDTWETKLILDNTQETSKWEEAWGKNWHRAIKAGKFEPEKAELVVSKYLVPVARGKRKYAGDVTPDPEIDPEKVNKAEIVHNIISDYEENEKYREGLKHPVPEFERNKTEQYLEEDRKREAQAGKPRQFYR